MRRIIISIIIIIFLLTTLGCQPVSPSVIEPVSRTKCVLVQNGSLDFGKIAGNIVSSNYLDSIILTNKLGEQVYPITNLTTNVLEFNDNLYIERQWFTSLLPKANGKIIYEVMFLAAGSTFSVIGELDVHNKNYRTFYVARELSDMILIGSFDNSHLLFKDHKRVDKMQLVLLNTATGNLESFSPSFSPLYNEVFFRQDNVLRILNHVEWYEHQFSPDKSRVFLFVSNRDGMKYILWDNKHEKIIWEKSAFSPSPSSPNWSPSSDKIVFVDREDLIILTKDGEESHLLLPPGKYLPAYMPFKWSPNGSLLAFWVGDSSRRDDPIQSFQLVVYNNKSDEMINTCIVSEGRSGELFWSPDGKQIVISEKNAQYLWLNVQEERAVRFNLEQGKIIGWIK